MKLFFLLTVLLSTTVFAHERCHYRFRPDLAVDLVVNDRMGENKFGSISWDDANVCGVDPETGTEICTEIYPGTFKVSFKDRTPPDTQGAITFRIRTIGKRDDNGNRYRKNSALGRFVRGARFVSYVIPEPNVTIFYQGKEYEMKCREQGHD